MVLQASRRVGIQIVRVIGGLTEQFVGARGVVGPQRRLALLEQRHPLRLPRPVPSGRGGSGGRMGFIGLGAGT